MTDITLAQGECDVCGMPGIVGMNCSDPDCRGTVKDLELKKTKSPAISGFDDDPEKEDDGRYDPDLLKDETVLSLEDLEDEEDAKPDAPYDDVETI